MLVVDAPHSGPSNHNRHRLTGSAAGNESALRRVQPVLRGRHSLAVARPLSLRDVPDSVPPRTGQQSLDGGTRGER